MKPNHLGGSVRIAAQGPQALLLIEWTGFTGLKTIPSIPGKNAMRSYSQSVDWSRKSTIFHERHPPYKAELRPPISSWASTMKMIVLLFSVATIYVPAFAAETNKSLSEKALLAYASTPYDRVDKHIVSLGELNGIPVIAEYICSDVCPDYTVRVIRYDLNKDQTCNGVGGIEKALRIPVGIAATDKTFCFPKVLVTNWNNYQRKLSYMPSGVGPHE